MNKSDGLLKNLSWKFAERISAQLVTTVVAIILARILDPSHYGLISIVTIFVTLANTLVTGGFGNALIQKKDADALDFSTILYFNIAFSILLYFVLFIAAPYIARFYGEGYELICPVLRVLGLRIIVAGINSVQQAYVSREMIFEKFFWATLFGTIASAVVGIVMAYSGYGVWALVAQYLTNTTVDTIFLAFSLKKIPLLQFSFQRLKSLFGFGARILATSMLISLFEDLRSLIIGKLYTSADLAYFDRGKQFPGLIVTNINSSIGSVLFPKMSRQQDDIQQVKNTARMAIRFSSYVMSPLLLGLAAVAESFVVVVLTDKWLPVVPLLQTFCIYYLFQPVHTANMQAIKAVGRGDVYFKLEIVKKVIEIVTLVCVIWFGINAIAISMAVLASLFVFVNAIPNKKLINYSFVEQMKDIIPSLGIALIMALIVMGIGYLPMNKLLLLCLQVVVGGIIYLGLSVITKNQEYAYIFNMIKGRVRRG